MRRGRRAQEEAGSLLCGAAGHYAVAAMLRLAATRLPAPAVADAAAAAAADAAAAQRLCERYAGLVELAVAGESDEWLYGRAG